MRKITVAIEWHNDHELALEMEHISQLIMDGQTGGEGWDITGHEEAEPEDPQAEVDKENAKGIFPININD